MIDGVLRDECEKAEAFDIMLGHVIDRLYTTCECGSLVISAFADDGR